MDINWSDSLIDDVIRVGRVADSVRAAQQHLEGNVGNEFAQFVKSLPRTLVQEAHGNVERCTCNT